MAIKPTDVRRRKTSGFNALNRYPEVLVRVVGNVDLGKGLAALVMGVNM